MLEVNPHTFLKPAQAAEVLQISKRAVYYLIKAGHLPVIRLTGKTRARIPMQALLDMAKAEAD